MNFEFHAKKITGVLTVLPEREVLFDDEIGNYNFSESQSLRLKKVMGYEKRRIVGEGTCTSDLCVAGLTALFDRGLLQPEEIGALIVVTQSPDFLMPPTSFVVHGRLALGQDVFCLDIAQGCAGFIIGLINAFHLLDSKSIRKVVLLNADVLSKRVSSRDRNSNPLIGDGASVTIVERDSTAGRIIANLKVDGSRCDALKIPAGGFRLPSSPDTAKLETDESGNQRAQDHLVMQGDAVFTFVQNEVPLLVEELLRDAQIAHHEVDDFFFHQPNRFMLQKLADRLGVPRAKMPSNVVENFGNSSGVSIPTTLCFNQGASLVRQRRKVCLAGFGVGLTWTSMLMDLGPLDFCEIITYENDTIER